MKDELKEIQMIYQTLKRVGGSCYIHPITSITPSIIKRKRIIKKINI